MYLVTIFPKNALYSLATLYLRLPTQRSRTANPVLGSLAILVVPRKIAKLPTGKFGSGTVRLGSANPVLGSSEVGLSDSEVRKCQSGFRKFGDVAIANDHDDDGD